MAHSRLRSDAGERVGRRKTGVASTEAKESRHQGGWVSFSWYSQVLVSSSQVSRVGWKARGWVWEVWTEQSLLSGSRWWIDLEDRPSDPHPPPSPPGKAEDGQGEYSAIFQMEKTEAQGGEILAIDNRTWSRSSCQPNGTMGAGLTVSGASWDSNRRLFI